MAKTKKPKNSIVCSHGITYYASEGIEIIYKPAWWWVQVNPRLYPSAWRHSNRKVLLVNGKRSGYAEERGGLIPILARQVYGKGTGSRFKDFFRKHFGVGCRKWEMGYVYVKLYDYQYAITKMETDSGILFCEVWDISTQRQIGSFDLYAGGNEMYIRSSVDGTLATLRVLMGYMADCYVFASMAASMEREITIKG